ncbi:MAG: hypothetical protein U9M90_03375 [Patescibacteria group bacterium]|nr:hypothetical protein [Patescibacteria group bacterium]
MARVNRCTICKKETERLKIRRFYFCESCQDNFCNFCRKPLSQEEKDILPKRRGVKLCLECLIIELEREKEGIIRKYDFLIKFQRCKQCGALNDSRDKDGKVTIRFCRACRKKFKEHIQVQGDIAAMTKYRPEHQYDKRTVVFD